ncbi:MAG: Uma2 family endonuclease [Chloroflexota bacterium]
MTTVAPPRQQADEKLQMTYEEFLDRFGEDDHTEWVRGEVIRFMSVNPIHQQIVDFLNALLRLFIESRNAGWVMSGPAQTRLPNSGREPDLFFVSQGNSGQLKEKFFEGVPDLVVEVISDDSVSRDRVDKFDEYEEAGVREYWIIDPRPKRRRADFYQLGADGKYRPVPTGDNGIYRSMVLKDFWLNVNWLWQDPLPKVMQALSEIEKK